MRQSLDEMGQPDSLIGDRFRLWRLNAKRVKLTPNAAQQPSTCTEACAGRDFLKWRRFGIAIASQSREGSRMTNIEPLGNVIAVETSMSFDHVLESLRVDLHRQEFRILSEVNFRRELDSQIGISASAYAVLIIWHPFSAYQALLSDPNGGLMVPFNMAVYRNGTVTTVSVLNQPSLRLEPSLGIRGLGQDLNRRMRDLLLHLGTHEIQNGHRKMDLAKAVRA